MLWRVEATRRIATWDSGDEQPKRINHLGFLALSSQSFSMVLYMGEENRGAIRLMFLPQKLSQEGSSHGLLLAFDGVPIDIRLPMT